MFGMFLYDTCVIIKMFQLTLKQILATDEIFQKI